MQRRATFRRDAAWHELRAAVRVAVRDDRRAWLQERLSRAEQHLGAERVHLAFEELRPLYKRRTKSGLPSWAEFREATEECKRTLVEGVHPPSGVAREVTAWPPVALPRPPYAALEQQEWVDVFTDGSGVERNGEARAGYGVFCERLGIEKSGRVHGAQTAQRGEVSALVAALMLVPGEKNVRVFTDSTYVMSGLAKVGRFRADAAEGEEHADLWRAAALLTRERLVEAVKVAAHTGVPGNEKADVLAKAGCGEEQAVNMGVDVLPEEVWDGTVEDGPPTEDEVRRAVRQLKSFKAEGHDGIGGECMKAAFDRDPECWQGFVECVQTVWATGDVPQQWCDVPCVWIPKPHGGARIVAMVFMATKVLSRILVTRCEAAPILPEQNGFVRHRSTLLPILALKLLVEEAHRAGRRLFGVFLDVKQAYYSLDRDKLFTILPRYGLGPQALRVLQAAYDKERVAVKIRGRFGSSFGGCRGVKAGDVASP